MEGLSIRALSDPAACLARIDPNEADGDFLRSLAERDRDMVSLWQGEELVGAADVVRGRRAWLYVYVFPPFRGRGLGAAAVEALEARLDGAERILTCWRSGDAAARTFAEARGYRRSYSSDYMVYRGAPFGEEAPVRRYRDEDWPAVHEFYAQAFHLMRLGTGCFPDSVPEPPSEEMRAYWAETAGERLVYELDGEPVGYAHLEGDMLDAAAVAPERQGEGIGMSLVKYAVDRILAAGHREAGLYCVVGNPARRLYERLGFAAVRRNDYGEKRR